MTQLMKARDAAEYIGCDVQTVYRKARAGELPCYRLGKLVRFKKMELDEAMRGGRNAKNDETRR